MSPAIDWMLANSDPANLGLLAVVWWRLDRRIRSLAQELD